MKLKNVNYYTYTKPTNLVGGLRQEKQMNKRSGKLQCGICNVDVVIGYKGLAFCPNSNCQNSERDYLNAEPNIVTGSHEWVRQTH